MRTLLMLCCLLPALSSQAGSSAPGAAHSQAADVLLVNGTVFIGDPAQPAADAIAIRGERIIAVGNEAALAAHVHAGTTRIDLGGRRVVPGINDAHEHRGWQPPPGVSLKLPEPEVSGAELEAALAAQPQGDESWIRGTIAAQVFTDLSWNTARLDALQPTRPVVLSVVTGHGLLLNSAAIRALEVDPSVPVAGGWYGRDAAGGFDGRLFEYAGWKAARQYPRSPDATHVGWLRNYGEAASKAGITSLQNFSWTPLPQFLDLWRQSGAPQRLRAIRWPLIPTDEPGIPDLDLPRHPTGTRIEISGTKWILDGTPFEQASPMREPYPDTGRNGRLNFSHAEMRAMLEEIIARGDQPILHVVGDAATEATLDVMALIAPPQEWRKRRVRFEHGDGLTPDLIPRAAEFGIVVVQNPSHQMLPDHLPVAKLLRERKGSPFADLLEAGIPLAIGSDGPMDPWLNMMFATALPTRPDQSLTREQVLRAYTEGSAFAEFKEHEKGRLAPGYLADLAVLSQDVLDEAAVPLDALPATRSLLTIIAGEIAWRDPSL
jgi:hypothetical protein